MQKEGAFSHGSWRACKIPRVSQHVCVVAEVLMPNHIRRRERVLKSFFYEEIMHSAEGEITLGEMVDLLVKVMARTDQEHWERSEEIRQEDENRTRRTKVLQDRGWED